MVALMATRMGNRRIALGGSGEALVASWYEARGGEVVARNWRCRNGELDLVVRFGSSVVFCEVKTRSSSAYGNGLEAVTAAKQRRLRQLAVLWLREQGGGFADLRFDVASVDDGIVTLLEGAF